VPVPVNLIATSVLIIYIGAHRSLRLRDKTHPSNETQDTVTKDDAMKFPLMGSCVLFGLYMVFKIFNKVNCFLSVHLQYFLFHVVLYNHCQHTSAAMRKKQTALYRIAVCTVLQNCVVALLPARIGIVRDIAEYSHRRLFL
jgi:Signal peptide peptidase